MTSGGSRPSASGPPSGTWNGITRAGQGWIGSRSKRELETSDGPVVEIVVARSDRRLLPGAVILLHSDESDSTAAAQSVGPAGTDEARFVDTLQIEAPR